MKGTGMRQSKCCDLSDVSAQSQLLQALLVLMEHSSLMQWTDVSDAFVSKIAENITGRAKQEDNTLLLSSLNIIDLVLNSKRLVHKEGNNITEKKG